MQSVFALEISCPPHTQIRAHAQMHLMVAMTRNETARQTYFGKDDTGNRYYGFKILTDNYLSFFLQAFLRGSHGSCVFSYEKKLLTLLLPLLLLLFLPTADSSVGL